MSSDVGTAELFETKARGADTARSNGAELLHSSRGDAAATLFLQKIADASSSATIDASRVAVVVAHPDDETIGCGALLSRLANVTVVLVTDGAPRNGVDALHAGYETPAAYGSARAKELRAALAVAGIGERQIVELGVADQEVCRALSPIARRLASLFERRGTSIVLTHAFEAGHPDHDGVAFCVHAAAGLLAERAPALIEMPFYHLGIDGIATQSFCDGEDEVVVELPASQSAIKAQMMSAHASQAETMVLFGAAVERYRTAKAYDFRSLPNAERAFYSTFDCGFAAQEWAPLAKEALSALSLARIFRL